MDQNKEVWFEAMLPINSTIEQAIRNLDQFAIKIVLVVNAEGGLEGTITDGDIRRGLLKGLNLTNLVTNIVNRNPFVVPPGIGFETVNQLMVVNKVQQIPVVDHTNRVVGLHLWNEIATTRIRPSLMVIMAGGLGTRLRPLTEKCPKPLLSVAGKPILQHIIERAKSEGFQHFLIALNYLGEMIEDHFGNGHSLDVQIDYLREQSPLGTAGALSLLNSRPNEPFIVTNGDIITDIRYGEMLDFHTRLGAVATMAVRKHEWQHPFGVVHTQGVEIVGFEEKPVTRSHINVGIYALNPDALGFLSEKAHCDMPTLFDRLQAKAKRIVAYPIHEPWLDVGRLEDLERACTEVGMEDSRVK